MFVGHYGPSFAIKAVRPAIPLWLLFISVQLVDVAWSILILLGVEKARIVPGITASNPFDLYYFYCVTNNAMIQTRELTKRRPRGARS